jgi:hypothetical protein
MSANQSYALYLTDEVSADVGGDPLHADAVDFYDSGVWVTHADGRDFFPYERVLRIREGNEGPADEAAESLEHGTTGERRDAASGTSGTVDEPTLDVK